MAELPIGTITLLFTDIEGSTRLLRRAGDAYAGLLSQHRSLLSGAFLAHRGVVVDQEGDAFFVVGSGTVNVVQNGAVIRRIGPGEYFGEVALLRDQPRNANVIAG
jgi:CRP-like cAMP-binding protein